MLSNNVLSVDQAEGLRNLSLPTRVIAITGGKGGIGKSSTAVNLALALQAQHNKVLLWDADLGLANIDVLLGLNAKYNISHFINGERELHEVIMPGPGNISILPAASGVETLLKLDLQQHAGIIDAFNHLMLNYDALIIDTPAGLDLTVTQCCTAANDVMVLVCDEPTSITDAYALIKVLSKQRPHLRYRMLANMVLDLRQARNLFQKLARACDEFLDITLDFAGFIPYDPMLQKAIRSQKAVLQAFPSSSSSKQYSALAREVQQWPISSEVSAHQSLFIERAINKAAQSNHEQKELTGE